MATQPVSSDPSTPLEQVEKESIEHVKTIEKEKPIAADVESPGLDVASSGPEETADVVVSDKESRNDSVPIFQKEHVSGGTDGDGLDQDLVKPKEETSNREVDAPEVQVNKAESELKPAEEIPEENQKYESPESLDAVAKEDHVEVKDSSDKIEVPDVTEVIDVGKNDDFSEQKARVIQESAEPEAADKIEVDAAKDEESRTESGGEPIVTTEEAHVEQKDIVFQPEAVIDTESESNTTERVVPEEDTVVNKEISDVSETEQTSKEIELPADLEGNKDESVGAAGKDVIEVEKKVDAEELHKPETGTERDLVAEKLDVDASKDEDNLNEDVEPVATQNVAEVPTSEGVESIDANEEIVVVGNNDELSVHEAKGIKEETNETELPDVAKESSEKTEVLESSVPEPSNLELEQSEAEITEAKDVKNEDLSDETTKELNEESVETDSVDKFEIDGAKDEESQANTVEGHELKSEALPEADTTVVDEAKGISDVSETSRDIELPTDTEGKKHETLASILKNEKDIEVEKKIDAEGSLEPEMGTKKEVEDTNAKNIDTETPSSEAEQNIDTQDQIKTEDDTNSIKTSLTDEAKKIEETTQISDDVSKADQTSREIELPADLEDKKGESIAATNAEPQESKTGTIEVEENAKLDAPNEESDDVKTTEEAPKDEEVVPKQKQSNNLLSKVKQSLVKAKKAIIKKTPSKTPPTS